MFWKAWLVLRYGKSKNLKKEKGFNEGLSHSTSQKTKNKEKRHYPSLVSFHPAKLQKKMKQRSERSVKYVCTYY